MKERLLFPAAADEGGKLSSKLLLNKYSGGYLTKCEYWCSVFEDSTNLGALTNF